MAKPNAEMDDEELVADADVPAGKKQQLIYLDADATKKFRRVQPDDWDSGFKYGRLDVICAKKDVPPPASALGAVSKLVYKDDKPKTRPKEQLVDDDFDTGHAFGMRQAQRDSIGQESAALVALQQKFEASQCQVQFRLFAPLRARPSLRDSGEKTAPKPRSSSSPQTSIAAQLVGAKRRLRPGARASGGGSCSDRRRISLYRADGRDSECASQNAGPASIRIDEPRGKRRRQQHRRQLSRDAELGLDGNYAFARAKAPVCATR